MHQAHTPHADDDMHASGPGATAVGGEAVTASAITDDLIQGGEIIILSLRPHVGSILLRALPVILFIALAGIAAELFRITTTTRIATTMAVLAGLAIALFAFDWSLTRYVLTDRRVMVIRGGAGIAGRIVTEALVPSVHRVTLEHSVRESLLGLGTLAYIPDHGEHIRWEMLGRAEDVYAIARDTIERYGRGRLDE